MAITAYCKLASKGTSVKDEGIIRLRLGVCHALLSKILIHDMQHNFEAFRDNFAAVLIDDPPNDFARWTRGRSFSLSKATQPAWSSRTIAISGRKVPTSTH